MTSEKVLSLIPDVISALEKQDCDFNVLLPRSQPIVEVMCWLEESFPIASWGRIIWEKVPGSTCLEWMEVGDIVEPIKSLCLKEGLHDSSVMVIWTNELRPALKLSLNAVLSNAAPIFEADFDTWIISRENGWCMECFHEGEICFGYAETLNKGAHHLT